MEGEARTDSSHQTGGTQGGAAQRAAELAKEKAGAVWSGAKETARARIDEQQQAAAEGIGQFAGALRKAADESGGDTMASVAQTAADGLERISTTLRSKDVDALVRDVQSFARAQPALFLGISVAAGFLAVRFLKSATPARSPSGHAAGTDAADPQPMRDAQYTETF